MKDLETQPSLGAFRRQTPACPVNLNKKSNNDYLQRNRTGGG